jgi:uncharacterized protein YigE (DUF2233 family)
VQRYYAKRNTVLQESKVGEFLLSAWGLNEVLTTTMNKLLFSCLLFVAACADVPQQQEAPQQDTTSLTQPTPVAAQQVIEQADAEPSYVSFVAEAENIKMYWQHQGVLLQNFETLKKVEPNLTHAMNGGMFSETFAPVGLYVEKGKQLRSIRRYNNPKVNFGLQPQGVFLVRAKSAAVIPIDRYNPDGVLYATQSAPMLVLNGGINPKLPHSTSRNIRNGVGMLPNGKVLMVLSLQPVTFQEFAQYFVSQGCSSALYLDGGISGAYTPEFTSDGYFGVMIGVVKKEK